eukprot:NODE_238_length_1065_cov_296.253715_g235_i0.p1 GENE.NODE_238_length_1065_cov_296.253715_g235_i0~~NODE_238_length_1065_cov_296.253715_g235_i0.p1  ORF type:complete len:222 (+),score=12.69 NODE_238_length_1065_cov_296.253715_g235_i0:260-925(+)
MWGDWMWRTIIMSPIGDTDVKGINAKQFEMPDKLNLLADARYHQRFDGFFNVTHSPQMGGNPIIISRPHFMGLDTTNATMWKYVNNSIKGMVPDTAKHSMTIDIEPFSGMLINGHRRLQMNSFIDRHKFRVHWQDTEKDPYNERPYMIVPIVWAHETAMIPDPMADQMKMGLMMAQVWIPWLAFALLILCAGACGFCAYSMYSSPTKWPEEKAEPTKKDEA